MKLLLQEIVPTYLDKEQIRGSEIWGRHTTFERGEHVYIVAPSGSGKTSLIHFMYGLRRDYKGMIFYDDKNIRKFSVETFSRYRQKNISIIFQDLRLFPQQTALQNIEIKRQLAPFHPAEKIDEMAKRLGIASRLDKPAKTCSYGEQQRIGIIRSLMQPFDFLLLDEPFSNLDENNRRKAFDLIREECDMRKASMIFAELKELDFFKGEKIIKL